MELVLALDAGTTGVRCVAYGPRLEVVASSHRELPQHFPSPGWVEHDARDIARLSLETMSELAQVLLSQGHEIIVVGLTNQRETTIGFSRATGELCHRAIVWQDRRTTDDCELLRRGAHEDEIRKTTGLVLDPYFSGTKMKWLLEHTRLAQMDEPALATVDSYLVWILTGGVDGGVFRTEASNASRTMLMDLAGTHWSPEMSILLGVPTAMLATIIPSASHWGTIAASAVPELEGVPICGVLGDQQAALFGQACFQPGMVKATYGTGAFVLALAGDVSPPPQPGLISTVAWNLGQFGPTSYAYEGSAFVAGAAVQWMRDELGLIDKAEDLEALAHSVSDSGGVSFVPAFTGLGSPFWDADARGSLLGLTRGTSRGHIARAVLEAQAFQVRAMTDAFATAGVALHEVRADGGMAAMNSLMHLQACASRVRVRRSTSLEATARGVASLAGLEAGMWGSLEEISDLWTSDYDTSPDNDPALEVLYGRWLDSVRRSHAVLS